LKRKGILRIGTSGIVIPGNKESFPNNFKHKSRLNYYSMLFNTIEINSTFKKMARVSTFERWSHDVPEDFQFTVKLSKDITHVRRLNVELDKIETFVTAANHLGSNKGCILIQFPGSITSEFSREVEQILLRLRQVDRKNEWRKAVEFRSSSWYNSQTHKLLHQYGASLVLHDMPASKNLDYGEAANFSYFRFHGPKGDYRGSYSAEFLEEQAKKIRKLLNQQDVYVYFNNTMGNALENALAIKSCILEEKIY
jgi:uncharacterized protein YecE (DUF72 family)